jgi:hypothetical protein
VKLYDQTEYVEKEVKVNLETFTLEDIGLESYYQNKETIGAIKDKILHATLLRDYRSDIKSKEIGTTEYMTAMECSRIYISSITHNLAIPSLEDFEVSYALESCNNIAMEGITDLIKKIWKTVINFLKDIGKRIKLFFKRLLNMELEIEQYDEYIGSMITFLKSKKDLKTIEGTVSTKLPSMLASINDTDYSYSKFTTKGRSKIQNLVEVLNDTALTKLSSLETFMKNNEELLLVELTNSPDGDTLYSVEGNAITSSLTNSSFSYIVDSKIKNEIVSKFFYSDVEDIEDNTDSYTVMSTFEINDNESVSPNKINSYLLTTKATDYRQLVSIKGDPGNVLYDTNVIVNELEVPKSLTELVDCYDFYRKINREINIDKLNKTILKVQDRLTKYSSNFSKKLTKLKESDEDHEGDSKIELSNNKIRITSSDKKIIKALLEVMNEDKGKEVAIIGSFIDMSMKEGTFIDVNKNIISGIIINSYTVTIDENNVKTVNILEATTVDADNLDKDLITEVSLYMKDYVSSAQELLNTYTNIYAKTYMSLRLEYAKYLYNSCREFY